MTVEPGHSLFSIAQQHGVRIEELIRANPQVGDPNNLWVGQKICMPRPPEPPEPPSPPPPPPVQCKNGTVVVVVAGESLWLVAQKRGTTVEAIMKANPQIHDPSRIAEGQKLCVPFPPPPSCLGGAHFILGKVDSLASVALDNGISLDELLVANPQISHEDVLAPGQIICVPGRARTPHEALEPIPKPSPKAYDAPPIIVE